MSLPSQIGRYRVVGRLATGGMAEILLGKISGPGGFERAVVIKRILPHLAEQTEFVRMFLDEARIVARIQHPNVVQVFELGHDGDELFLAMEYLEGESALGVMRRGAKRGQKLGYALSAHVVAQCCAGLHAAHDVTDDDGKPLHLVHRDVSPHNIFITYAGEVKVLDFGIARFEERASETQGGQLKGKFAYMSPEQCRTSSLDRRSDVFALGTVLFELTTGKRLFARDTALETMRAICEDPIPLPSSVCSDYPASLEAVCRRALARNPADRYATAAEMRRDLVMAVRALDLDEPPDDALATFMRAVFPDREREKRELVRRLGSGSEITNVPMPEVDVSIELPPALGGAPSQPSATPFTAESPVAPAPAQRARRWPMVALAVGVAIGGVAGATLGGVFDAEPPARSAASSIAPAPIAPAPGQEGGGEAAPEPAAAPDRAEARPETTPSGGDDAAPAEVSLRIDSAPPGARVRVDGADRGTTPLELRVARGEAAVEVSLHRQGFETWREEIVPTEGHVINAALRRRAGGRSGSAGNASTTTSTASSTTSTTTSSSTTTTSGSPFRRFQ